MTIELELEDVSTENIKKMTELLKTDLEKLNKEADEDDDEEYGLFYTK